MKRSLRIAAVFALLILLCSLSVSSLSKVGSRGEEVRTIQQKLADEGYYTDTVDGIYGTNTRNAVKSFQTDHGLTPDGIVGEQTLNALGVTGAADGYGGYESADYELLARLISAEARGESYLGQVAVGAVVINRVSHPSFPDTITAVIYQNGAFSCLKDGQFYEPVSDSAYRAARDALNGLDPSGGAIYYYNPDVATNRWIFSRPVITTIDNHVFCS